LRVLCSQNTGNGVEKAYRGEADLKTEIERITKAKAKVRVPSKYFLING